MLLVASVALFFVACTLFGLAIGFALEKWWPRRIWAESVAKSAHQHRLELRGNVTFVLTCIVTLTGALHFELARLGDDSLARAALTFVALLVGFQAFYYVLHRALHTHALVRFHRHHHESRVTGPLSGQSTSLVEALGWMIGYAAMPIAFSLVAPISLYGWFAYLAFNVVTNIVGHANAEVVGPSRWLRQRAIVAPAFTFHALHHARWTGHYGFESVWADRLLGSEWNDWIALHARISAGTPLTSLKERAHGAHGAP